MAEQNILAGDVNVLDQMINDLNVHKETIERQGRLAESIGDIAKNTKEAQQAVQDEIDSRVKDSSDAVCAGFDKAIAGDREKMHLHRKTYRCFVTAAFILHFTEQSA